MLPLKTKANALLLRVASGVACGLALVGCSDEGHPPLAGDGWEESAPVPNEDPVSGESLIGDDDTDGRCAGVDVQVEVLRPNFYFLLDGSDSMEEEMPGSAGVSRHDAARYAILDMLRVSGHRVNFGVSAFPDPSGEDGCDAGRAIFPLSAGEPLRADGSDNALLDALAFTMRKYSPRGATPVTASLAKLREELVELPSTTRLFLMTDGAPNCAPKELPCSADKCIPNIEAVRFEGLPACDEDFNCCTEALPHMCLDDDGVVREVEALTELGIETYVVGMPGSETYADVLARIARAAGTARSDGPTEYYAVSDAEELAETLTVLGEQLSSSCEFALGSVPRDADRVRVALDGEALELDAADGYRWQAEDAIELLGRACRKWQRGKVSTLAVVESCVVKAR